MCSQKRSIHDGEILQHHISMRESDSSVYLTAFCCSLKLVHSSSSSEGTGDPDSSRALMMSPAYRTCSSVMNVYAYPYKTTVTPALAICISHGFTVKLIIILTHLVARPPRAPGAVDVVLIVVRAVVIDH